MADIDASGGACALASINSPAAIFVHCDITRAASVETLVREVEQSFGRVYILFNNAGIMHAEDRDAILTSERVWDLTMNVNAKGVFYCCKYGIPALPRAGGGVIINTASFVAIMGAATPQTACTNTASGFVLIFAKIRHQREQFWP